MKVRFHIRYQTLWGQTLHAVVYRFGATAVERKINIPLHTQDGLHWEGEIQLLLKQPLRLSYHYEVRQQTQVLRREWQQIARVVYLNPQVPFYEIHDQWRDLPAETWMYTSCMTSVFHPRSFAIPKQLSAAKTILLRVQTARPQGGSSVWLSGACKELGEWNPALALPLEETSPNEWSITLDTSLFDEVTEYKFFVRDGQGEIYWEQGPNRLLDPFLLTENGAYVLSDLRPQFAPAKPFRAAGVVIPVFSLRSQGSWGVGDFGDLKKLTDWAVKTAQHVIQILPINDTSLTYTWQDSYPYNALSVYAFHPIYTDIRQLPPLRDKRLAPELEEEGAQLNTLAQVDYEKVLQLKLQFLKASFKQDGKQALSSAEFRSFFMENKSWLQPYAMFCVLRDLYHTADFRKWPRFSPVSAHDISQFCAEKSIHILKIQFWYYVQFILHTQLLGAVSYARSKGVILKGDIPIGISPNSVDAWVEPRLFHLDVQAGAPPDDFSATGQNWGFPTYNWELMARNGYRWWMQRLTHMARYFDAYRIDHVLGFFRIWQIPMHSVEGLLGHFSPALPLSKQEIERFGLFFRPSLLTPYIDENLITELFGENAPRVKKKYLLPTQDGFYQLRPAYDTQRKIEELIPGKDEKSQQLRKGLYALVSNVLFVKDDTQPEGYHPRIAALTSSAFKALSEKEQAAFTHLYNDFFFHRHNDFWKQGALRKLIPLTQCTRMLCCAEDLGMIPDCVPEVMQKLQLLSLEIQRMPKHLGETFADTRRYPYVSVATPSTHDMSTLRGWWQEDATLTQRFYNEVLGEYGQAPAQAPGYICEKILRMHLESPSMLALISLQDWQSMDETLRAPNPEAERINIPAHPHHYWRYRMNITLEELLQKDWFNNKIKEMITKTER